jgi:hypothetical protein
MDPNAEKMDKWKVTMSSMLRIDKDDDGDKPVVGQFQTAPQTPHTEQLRQLAGLFAGETGLTLDDLGFPSQNPSSAEAIEASHRELIETVEKAQRTFGTGFLNAGFLCACIRDDYPYLRQQIYLTKPKFKPPYKPNAAQFGAFGDAIMKIKQVFPDYSEEELRTLIGF